MPRLFLSLFRNEGERRFVQPLFFFSSPRATSRDTVVHAAPREKNRFTILLSSAGPCLPGSPALHFPSFHVKRSPSSWQTLVTEVKQLFPRIRRIPSGILFWVTVSGCSAIIIKLALKLWPVMVEKRNAQLNLHPRAKLSTESPRNTTATN